MNDYIHNIPGRLRVKSPLIKRNSDLAARVGQILKFVHGIHSVQVRVVTGSVLVHYNPSEVSSDQILLILNQRGYLGLSNTTIEDQLIDPLIAKAARIITSVLFGVWVEEQMKYSVRTLITALI